MGTSTNSFVSKASSALAGRRRRSSQRPFAAFIAFEVSLPAHPSSSTECSAERSKSLRTPSAPLSMNADPLFARALEQLLLTSETLDFFRWTLPRRFIPGGQRAGRNTVVRPTGQQRHRCGHSPRHDRRPSPFSTRSAAVADRSHGWRFRPAGAAGRRWRTHSESILYQRTLSTTSWHTIPDACGPVSAGATWRQAGTGRDLRGSPSTTSSGRPSSADLRAVSTRSISCRLLRSISRLTPIARAP